MSGRAAKHAKPACPKDEALALIGRAKLPHYARVVGIVLARRLGDWVSIHELVDALYADRLDGGPLSAEQVPRTAALHLKRALAETPFEIEKSWMARRMVCRRETRS